MVKLTTVINEDGEHYYYNAKPNAFDAISITVSEITWSGGHAATAGATVSGTEFYPKYSSDKSDFTVAIVGGNSANLGIAMAVFNAGGGSSVYGGSKFEVFTLNSDHTVTVTKASASFGNGSATWSSTSGFSPAPPGYQCFTEIV